MKKKTGNLFFLIVLLIFVACDNSRVYEENKNIPDHEWEQDEPLVFLAQITDTTRSHNVYINVRNAGHYRFSNLFLFISTRLPQGQIQRDTLECVLASEDGRWLGDGLGDIWDNRILFKRNLRFPQTGEYRFELTQAMRVNPLPGIMDAGIRIEKMGSE